MSIVAVLAPVGALTRVAPVHLAVDRLLAVRACIVTALLRLILQIHEITLRFFDNFGIMKIL